VHLGIKAAVQFRLGRSDLRGVRIAIQGVGGVGHHLCGLLAAEGAELFVADVQPAAVQRACALFGAHPVGAEEVLALEVDVLAPCALGGVLDSGSIPRLRARIVAGAANNQLAEGEDGSALQAAGILYAPDYVINAGGAIALVGLEQLGWSGPELDVAMGGIGETLREIYRRAEAEGVATAAAADALADARLRGAA
jgi:leucine dehydrogenase